MLTIYQQIQEAVDLVEADLARPVTAEDAAHSAGMSLRNLHRYFPALTGYRFGEYVRRRRLSTAVAALRDTDASILTIAVDSGYDSNEAFTRAFRNEFGITPSEFRTVDRAARLVQPIDLVGEVNMGVLTKTLPEMNAVVFDGFQPDPEETALSKMSEWIDSHPDLVGSHRVFGHNIDHDGNIAHDPENVGYRVYVTIPRNGSTAR